MAVGLNVDIFAGGNHAYMKILSPLMGEILKFRHEPANEVAKNAKVIHCFHVQEN